MQGANQGSIKASDRNTRVATHSGFRFAPTLDSAAARRLAPASLRRRSPRRALHAAALRSHALCSGSGGGQPTGYAGGGAAQGNSLWQIEGLIIDRRRSTPADAGGSSLRLHQEPDHESSTSPAFTPGLQGLGE